MRRNSALLVVILSNFFAVAVASWSAWSKCNVTCGEGVRTRKRPCEPFELGCDDGSSVVEKKECSFTPCGGLSCYEGISSSVGGLEVINTFQIRKCEDIAIAPRSKDKTGRNGLYCAMVNMQVERAGVTVNVLQGTCLNSELCSSVNCDEFTKMMGLYDIKSCEVRCCRSDWCNKPSKFRTDIILQPDQPDPCAISPCHNSGSCVTVLGESGLADYVCACAPGFKGKNCTEASKRICHTGVSLRYAAIPVDSPMLPTSCANPDDSCMVATVGAFMDGKSAYVDTAQCVKTSVCSSLSCDGLKKTMPDYNVQTCKIVCCDDDLCNTAPLDLPPPPTTTKAPTTTRKRTTRKPRTTKAPRKTRKPRTTRKPSRTTPAATLKPPPRTTPKPTPAVDTSGPHWSDWQPWQGCTHLCGNDGTRRRFRYCMKGAPGMPGCMPQDGSTEEEPCNRGMSCIRWREWNSWQSCSRSCQGGTQERRRSCDGGAPNTGDCIGSDMEQQQCNEQSCDASTSWREWNSWQSCSRSCDGGTQERRRSCDGGAPNSGGCIGSDIEQQRCNEQSCDASARWREWNSWQTCSRSCDGGTQERRRSCDGGAPNTGGCIGSDIEQQKCKEQSCDPSATPATRRTTTTTRTTTKPPPTITMPKGPKWSEWSDWNQCGVTCGLGVQIRNRKCVGRRRGRKGCRGRARQTQDCNSGECGSGTATTTTTEPTTKKQKPGWTKWTDWQPCSVSCGAGTTERTRQCIGGRIGRRGCRGKKMGNKKCETPCPTLSAGASTSLPVVECLMRDAQRAQRGGRRCQLECNADSNCDDGNKCVCDGYCGKTCQDVAKMCINVLSSDLEGTIIKCSNGIFVGSRCTYSCQTGYTLQGNADIFCQGNTKWTSQKDLPRCIASAGSVTTPATTPVPECTFRLKVQDSCCGNKPYNSRKARCCNGRVRNAGPAMTECCNTVAYDPRKKGCCGTKSFKLSGFKCQNGLVVPK